MAWIVGLVTGDEEAWLRSHYDTVVDAPEFLVEGGGDVISDDKSGGLRGLAVYIDLDVPEVLESVCPGREDADG